MGKFKKKFENIDAYESFKIGDTYVEPHVAYITGINNVIYKKYVEPSISLCDIAYWDGNNIKTIAKDKWSSSLGTPVGVVVIPEGMLPDGKARMISLKPVDSNGNASTSHIAMKWSNDYETDTSLTNFTKVPITDNSGSTTTGSSNIGYLPSDKFTGAQSFVDAKAKYNGNYSFIPSPYLRDDKTLNPDYCKAINGYSNVLSDFNGLSNTQTLVGLGSDYVAANAAWNYSDGVSSTQWYLPAMGELGFLMPRLNAINSTITAVGGIEIDDIGYYDFLSSSEYNDEFVYVLGTDNGYISGDHIKDNRSYMRPFGLL